MKTLKSLLAGFGTIVDLMGTRQLPLSYYSYFHFDDLPEYEDPDLDAIAKDWVVVGRDLFGAYQKFEEDNRKIV